MSKKKQNNPAELNENNLEGVSGGTVDFHVFEDGTSGWVASGSPGDIFKSSRDAITVDKASGGDGQPLHRPTQKNYNIGGWGQRDQWGNVTSRY